MRVARSSTRIFRPGRGEGDTTDHSLGYDLAFAHPGGGTTVEGEAPPPLDPPVSAPSTARQTAFPKLGAPCQTPAHRLPVSRRTADTTAVEPQGNPVRRFGRVGEGPGGFSGVRDVWALTVCGGQGVAFHDAWRRVFILFGSDGESSGDPAGRPRIRLDSGAAS